MRSTYDDARQTGRVHRTPYDINPPSVGKKRKAEIVGKRWAVDNAIIDFRRALVKASGNTMRPPPGSRAYCSYRAFDFGIGANAARDDFHRQRRSSNLNRGHEYRSGCGARIEQDGNSLDLGCGLFDKFQPLPCHSRFVIR